jgi:RNA polymerase sigma factor (sigma-70 family)
MAVSCLITAWRTHEAELLNFMRHRLNNPSEAEDLLHDLFLKAWAQGDNFCSVVNARAWLFEVARNTLIDRSRRTRNEVTLPECVFHPNSATHNDRNPPPVTTPSRPPIPPAKPPPIPIKNPPGRRVLNSVTKTGVHVPSDALLPRNRRIDSPLSSIRCAPLTNRSRIASAIVGFPPLK